MDSFHKTYKPYQVSADAQAIRSQERVCEGCDKFRCDREYAGLLEIFRYCAVCRNRGGSREILVKVKRAKGARA